MGYEPRQYQAVERDELEARQRLAEARDKAEMNAAKPRPPTTNSSRDSRRTGNTRSNASTATPSTKKADHMITGPARARDPAGGALVGVDPPPRLPHQLGGDRKRLVFGLWQCFLASSQSRSPD